MGISRREKFKEKRKRTSIWYEAGNLNRGKFQWLSTLHFMSRHDKFPFYVMFLQYTAANWLIQLSRFLTFCETMTIFVLTWVTIEIKQQESHILIFLYFSFLLLSSMIFLCRYRNFPLHFSPFFPIHLLIPICLHLYVVDTNKNYKNSGPER